EAVRQVALAARAHIRHAAVRDHVRHRRMLVRIPVRRRERIVDLRRGEAGGAPLEVIHLAVIGRTLLVLRLRIRPRRRRLTLSAYANGRCAERNAREDQNCFHTCLTRPTRPTSRADPDAPGSAPRTASTPCRLPSATACD